MSRAWFALAVAGVLGLFYVGAGLRGDAQEPQEAPAKTRRSRAVQPEPGTQQSEARTQRGRGGQVGRYQMAIRDGAQPSAWAYVVICDTTTGQCWVANLTAGGGQSWRDLGGPGTAVTRTPQPAEADTAPRRLPDLLLPTTPPLPSLPALDPQPGLPALTPPAEAAPRLPIPPTLPGRDA
jgi:hypothetical protein